MHRDNPAYFEEFFGPVVQVYAVKADDEIVELANDSNYGLSGVVFSHDVERAKISLRASRRALCGSIRF